MVSTLQRRLSALLELPRTVLQNSGTMQIVHYDQDGQYTLHLDSGLAPQPRSGTSGALPCCHLTKLKHRMMRALAHQKRTQGLEQEGQEQPQNTDDPDRPCRLCRYATVFYFLNTVPFGGGGETAFPMANNATLQSMQQQAILEKKDMANQSTAREKFDAEISRFRATDAAR